MNSITRIYKRVRYNALELLDNYAHKFSDWTCDKFEEAIFDSMTEGRHDRI